MTWRAMDKFDPGLRVKNVATGFTGLVMGVSQYTNGCVQFLVKPPVDKEGKAVEGVWMDDNDLVVVDKGLSEHYGPTPRKAGGPDRTTRMT